MTVQAAMTITVETILRRLVMSTPDIRVDGHWGGIDNFTSAKGHRLYTQDSIVFSKSLYGYSVSRLNGVGVGLAGVERLASTAALIATGWSEPVPGRVTPAVDHHLFTAHPVTRLHRQVELTHPLV